VLIVALPRILPPETALGMIHRSHSMYLPPICLAHVAHSNLFEKSFLHTVV
jgi:hypothetical protein